MAKKDVDFGAFTFVALVSLTLLAHETKVIFRDILKSKITYGIALAYNKELKCAKSRPDTSKGHAAPSQ